MSDQPTVKQQLIALAALTAVSTAIGFTMKISQDRSGQYRFNPASAVVMTELFKLVASGVIILKLLLGAVKEKPQGTTTLHKEAVQFYNQNVSGKAVIHLVGLAIAYSIVNLVTFGIFMAAPASMFFLMKAASPIITAIMLKALVNRDINSVQWISVIMQCVGLVVTQYNPCTKSGALTSLGYILIAINIGVSCGCGVWNEQIIKTYGNSVNAQNAVLYTCGVLVNLMVYWFVPGTFFGLSSTDASSLGFFDGYNWRVAAVIIANGSVGLVITAVYKYADVVVKTFGLAGSTVTLYGMEAMGILPASSQGASNMATFMGASVVFYAAYLYIAPRCLVEPAEKPTQSAQGSRGQEEEGQPKVEEEPKIPVPWHQDSRVVGVLVLAVGAIFTVLISSNACEQFR